LASPQPDSPDPRHPPHEPVHSCAHCGDHICEQQLGIRAHTQLSQPHPPQPLMLLPPGTQPWHIRQSTGQDAQSSPLFASHRPFPQPTQAPQSVAQVLQVSPLPESHALLPQIGAPHAPQSFEQLEHVSPPPVSHLPSPHPI